MIQIKNIVLRRGTKVVLQNASLTINPGEKVGLVGRNGVGKSSLFALLNGSLAEDEGELSYPKQWRMSQVAQNMPETDQSATEFVIDGDLVLSEAQKAVDQAELSGDGDAIANSYMHLFDSGANDAQSRAQALILGLGFKLEELNNPVNSFSGGWRMRLQLARALMSPSDLLLLDEPTNHLDLDALVWLEGWLKKYQGTLLVISHDREFLDSITKVTVHIENYTLNRYGGNYSSFEDQRAEQISLQQSAFQKQQEKIAHLQKFIARFKAKASKAKQAQSRVKALDRMEKIAPLLSEADFTFEFKEADNLPNPMIVLSDVTLGYGNAANNDTPKIIIKNLNSSIQAGQRLGILGANGQGKSTYVKTIAGDLQPLGGEITLGRGLTIGYFAQQELDILREDDTPLEHMIALVKKASAERTLSGQSTREQDLRSFLGMFNFSGDMIFQKVGTMSGGEKARLVLCMIVWQKPNLLLLDEPTNHLDLATREALSVALNEFEGSVILVSHDRALLRAVCDEFWMVSNGKVYPFDGDLDDYQQFLLDESKRLRDVAKKPVLPNADLSTPSMVSTPSSSSTSKPFQTPETKKLLKKISHIESNIASLNSEIVALELQIASTSDINKISQLGTQLANLQNSLSQDEEQWLELSHKLE
jgi:ATP-binding cassette, subfamily F, member 3